MTGQQRGPSQPGSGLRRWTTRLSALVLGTAAIAANPSNARATYSIVAADAATMEVGAAGTSCVGSQVAIISIYGSVPGTGAVVAQARLNEAGRDEAVRLLEQGTAPGDVIEAITSTTFDPPTLFGGAEQRQYAVVDVLGRSAGFTGSQTMDHADDRQLAVDPIAYSVQGNILTGPAVLEQARVGFEAPACDLAERLMNALEAGADNGQGDSRCTPDGIPSDGAFIQVDLPERAAGDFLRLEVNDTAPASPVVRLREQFEAWRSTHPCQPPAPMPDASAPAIPDAGQSAPPPVDAAPPPPATGGSGGSPGAMPTSLPGSGGTVASPMPPGTATGGSSSSPGPSAGAPGDAGDAGETPAITGDDGGCGCRLQSSSTRPRGVLALLVAALWTARRARRRRAALLRW